MYTQTWYRIIRRTLFGKLLVYTLNLDNFCSHLVVVVVVVAQGPRHGPPMGTRASFHVAVLLTSLLRGPERDPHLHVGSMPPTALLSTDYADQL